MRTIRHTRAILTGPLSTRPPSSAPLDVLCGSAKAHPTLIISQFCLRSFLFSFLPDHVDVVPLSTISSAGSRAFGAYSSIPVPQERTHKQNPVFLVCLPCTSRRADIPGRVKRENVKNSEECKRILRDTLPQFLLSSVVGRPNLYLPYRDVFCEFAHSGLAASCTTRSCLTYSLRNPHVILTSDYLHPSNSSSTTLLVIWSSPPPLNLRLNSNLPLNTSHAEPVIAAVLTRKVGVLFLDSPNRNLVEASHINWRQGPLALF